MEISPQRGEVWRVNLEPTVGEEMRKTRPCVIINQSGVGRLALRLVVPLTGWQENFAHFTWFIRIEPERGTGLTKTSAADVFQIRSVSLLRFDNKLGQLPNEDTERIAQAITFAVGGNFSEVDQDAVR